MATTTTLYPAAEMQQRTRPSFAHQVYVLSGWTWAMTWVTVACATACLVIAAVGL